MSELTRLLSAVEAGDRTAAGQLLPVVYEELRKLAAQQLSEERPGQTLQATALVHEAYLRLVGGSDHAPTWHGRGHFLAAAAEAMRRVLIDAARRKGSQRRGGDRHRCDLAADGPVDLPISDSLIDLDHALAKLRAADPRAADLATLRLFAGLSVEEIADLQDISARTVKRDWAYARAWLGRELAAYDDRG